MKSIFSIGIYFLAFSTYLLTSTTTALDEYLLAAGNKNDTATFAAVSREDIGIIFLEHPENAVVSQHCTNQTNSGLCELLLMNRTASNSISFVAFVPLENGVWLVELIYNDHTLSISSNYTLQYMEPCRTLGVFDLHSGIVTLCTQSNMLFYCGIQLQSDPFFDCQRNTPTFVAALPSVDLLSNMIEVGNGILFFFIGLNLDRLNVARESNHLSPLHLSNCDRVRHIAVENNTSILLYCRNNAIYRYKWNEDDDPELLRSGGCPYYYICQFGTFCIDDQGSVHFSGADGMNFTASIPSNFSSGQCFGEDILVYQSGMGGAYAIRKSNDGLSVASLDISEHLPSSILLTQSQYIVLQSQQRTVVVDSSTSDYLEIIHTNGTPAAAIAVVALPVSTTTETRTSSSSSQTTTSDPKPINHTVGKTIGAILGFVFWGLLLTHVICAIIFWWRKRRDDNITTTPLPATERPPKDDVIGSSNPYPKHIIGPDAVCKVNEKRNTEENRNDTARKANAL